MKRKPLKQQGLLRLKPLLRTVGLTGGGGGGCEGVWGGRGVGGTLCGTRYRQTDLTLPPSAVPSSRSALRPQPSCSAHPPTVGFFLQCGS